MTDDTNPCEGCHTYNTRIEYSLIPQCTSHSNNDTVAKCPCVKCVIKMLCINECQDFANFRNCTRFERRHNCYV